MPWQNGSTHSFIFDQFCLSIAAFHCVHCRQHLLCCGSLDVAVYHLQTELILSASPIDVQTSRILSNHVCFVCFITQHRLNLRVSEANVIKRKPRKHCKGMLGFKSKVFLLVEFNCQGGRYSYLKSRHYFVSKTIAFAKTSLGSIHSNSIGFIFFLIQSQLNSK